MKKTFRIFYAALMISYVGLVATTITVSHHVARSQAPQPLAQVALAR